MSTFAGERVVFDRCKFEGTNVLFDDVNYASGSMSFVEVEFSEGFIRFARTMLTGAKSIRTSSLPEERECVLRCCLSGVLMGLQRRHFRRLGTPGSARRDLRRQPAPLRGTAGQVRGRHRLQHPPPRGFGTPTITPCRSRRREGPTSNVARITRVLLMYQCSYFNSRTVIVAPGILWLFHSLGLWRASN